MMSKDESHIRDKLIMLAESAKPFNVKRKSIAKQMSKGSGGKLSMQDFVRMDPSYTPDIEHLVFPSRKRNPQQVAPAIVQSSASKTRSRLAEMFALSRHLQQRSADRETSKSARKTNPAVAINRSVDSMLETPRDSGIGSSGAGSRRVTGDRRWAAEEPVHAVRRSPIQEPDMAATRGPNVSVLHLRSTSEPWETSPTSVFTSVSSGSSRSYSSGRSASTNAGAQLPKQESLNFPTTTYKYGAPGSQSLASQRDHGSRGYPPPARADTYAGDPYASKSQSSCSKRELSPMRWCDREVDGVYLNRSGWVQVQHRSLDESRRLKYVDGLSASRRTGLKLAEYQRTGGKMPAANVVVSASGSGSISSSSSSATKCEPQRPAFLPLKANDYEPAPPPRTPSPIMCESFSPPLLTPIISPPPAFQDRTRGSKPPARTFFGKAPFLPRSNAIIDSDLSPPSSPAPSAWKNAKASSLPIQPHPTAQRKTKTPSPVFDNAPKYSRIPQTKSLEDTSASRRTKFSQKHESSSSSSQSQSQSQASQQFRSLDSYMPRAMPRLSENTDSSLDVYEDADDEDNNSSSINMSITTKPMPMPMNNSKISPSSRNSRLPYRNASRKSPVGSDTKPTSPGSSSSSSQEFAHSRSPSSTAMRRTPPRQYQHPSAPEDPKVRRSRSLQLPDKKANFLPQRVSPQQPEGSYRVIKVPQSTSVDRSQGPRRPQADDLDEEMLREADIVAGYIYGSRSRAAAQALLMSRYDKKDLNGHSSHGYKAPAPQPQKTIQRGATTPTMNNQSAAKADYWSGQYQRERDGPNVTVQQPTMRSSQSYPTHQRSLDADAPRDRTREREPYRKRAPRQDAVRRASPIEMEPRRLSPNMLQAMDERRRSSPKFKSSSSSSSDYAVVVPEKVRASRSAKSSGASTPLEDANHLNVNNCARGEVILTRPGSAPGTQQPSRGTFLDSSQRSMSLPKSFLSHRQGGQFPWKRRGTESLGSSPGFRRRTPIETSQTAPVTPLHDGNRRRSPSGEARRTKANSTPQLIDGKERDGRKHKSASAAGQTHAKESRKQFSGNAESVLQKFRKTFSLRFQKSASRGSKDGGGGSADFGDSFADAADHPSEEESSPTRVVDAKDAESAEQKHRFGPLIWRSSKERKKLNKAARSMKCNSGDSGIQIEMAPGCGGIGGDNSSESHGETDPQADDPDSPPAVRRRGGPSRAAPRPHSDLLNQILIDRFKAELRTRSHRHQHVRRTHSDLGGQRIYGWEARGASGRGPMSSSPSPLRSTRPQSPRKKPPDGPPHVQMRNHPLYRRGQLRRSLSQPLDIDKLSPIMKTKTGIKVTNAASEDENDMRLGTSDEETMSDSESSLASLSERKKSLELPMDEEVVILAEAVFDHVAIDPCELAFRAGDVVEVVDTTNRDWWWGSAAGKSGWFPVNSVRLRVSQEDTVEDCLASIASGKPAPSAVRRRTSISLLSNDQVRTSVVRELVHTERDFVKVLQDVAEGYVAECRKREDMFTKEQIDTIFINLEEILKFQTGFLRDLENCIDWEAPHKSCVGSCFMKHKDGFKMYSDYCNSHPMATATLQELYQFNNYSKFFEACRLMRGLIEIPLDGYLLTPVQRICKYPLQLAELLKYSKADHPDYEDIKEALEAMKGVAVLINERKRRMESLEKIEAWQQRVEGWEGEDLIEVSTQLIYQGEVMRMTTGLWTSNITLFLFDHQLVYCKKDILKRNTYMYKGRICLNTAEVIDMPDGKDPHLGVNLRHAIKIYSLIKDKFLLVCCRSVLDKQRWLQAFAEERRLVSQDECDGMDFPASSRHLAKIAARCQRRPPRKLRNKENYKRDVFLGSSLQLNGANTNSLGRKVGTWFTFGGNKKTRHRDAS